MELFFGWSWLPVWPFWGLKPVEGGTPGLSLRTQTPKWGSLSEQPAGTVCSSSEQTTGSLSALSTVPGTGADYLKEKAWEERCLLGGGWRGNGFVPSSSRRNLALAAPGEGTGPPARRSRSAFP